jgi:hypothetical protein
MGIVYRVEHVRTGERLALKVLVGAARFDPPSVIRFKREARAAARIRSAHVVRVTDADSAPDLDDTPFIVMELLHGSDLEHYVAKRGPLSPELVVALLTQIGEALELAHRLGIVHRDLKPANLFLHYPTTGLPIAKVLDFGISKVVTSEGLMESPNMTRTGSVLGTPLYMAPEQAHGLNDKIAPTTDVWAMGLVTLWLLTGEHYWGTPTMAELIMKLVVKPMIAPSERWPNGVHMSPALDAWFLKSCDRDQSRRWQSIEEQMFELAGALDIKVPSLPARSAVESIGPAVDAHADQDVALAATALSDAVPREVTVAFVDATLDTTGNSLASPLSLTAPVATPGVDERAARAIDDDMVELSRSKASKGPRRVTRFAALGGLAMVAIGGATWFLFGSEPTRSAADRRPAVSPSPSLVPRLEAMAAEAALQAPAESDRDARADAGRSFAVPVAASASRRASPAAMPGVARPGLSARPRGSTPTAPPVAASQSAAASSALYAPLAP